VEIEKAVSELCRVVKAGGRIAIIDKNGSNGKVEDPRMGAMVHAQGASSGCCGAIAARCRAGTSRIGRTWNGRADILAWLR